MKNDYVVVSFSGGKDSTAMLLRMIELGEHIDEVITCDTYMEFPAMYRHIDKVKQVVEAAGIKFTRLQNENTFYYHMFDYQKSSGKHTHLRGKAWPTPLQRWCTGDMKRDVIKKYLRELSKSHNIIMCNGIAADEGSRLLRKNNQTEDKRHPLVEWGWTEADCLKYCYDHGYDWEGLYTLFSRVSCWCCPLNRIENLRNLWKHFPDLWSELREMDKRAWNPFRRDYSVEDLEIRFELEEEMEAQGLQVNGRSKAFHEALKKRLKEVKR